MHSWHAHKCTHLAEALQYPQQACVFFSLQIPLPLQFQLPLAWGVGHGRR